MTEKEKVAKGLIYNPNCDAVLQEEMKQARIKTYEYNLLSPEKEDEKKSLLKGLLGKVGENYTFISPFYCDYGYNIEIGENFFANMNFVVLDGAKVQIGDNVFIAPNVGIYTAGHPLDAKQRREGLEYAKPVTIGNDVWIGANVTILPGVTIGDNSVIGAGSVVTKDIPANSLAVGNPCRVIRQIGNEAE
ncbi:sugar O-acetyltransferase [Paludibacter sp. 221]|uniref:sugar O-acetyltransferase n=1 Tax=Paludibacter sp. 221 TaxID=2302939 RepID=UPI0013D3C67D|nr:sugar O-acetyltransferase [Paludibacter sp. 221]NDV46577.1 sugar O-acetyltransferase [Paludibacter sp. 221]